MCGRGRIAQRKVLSIGLVDSDVSKLTDKFIGLGTVCGCEIRGEVCAFVCVVTNQYYQHQSWLPTGHHDEEIYQK